MRKFIDWLSNVLKSVSIEKAYLIITWIVSIIRSDNFTMTISFTALIVLWYIDRKFKNKQNSERKNDFGEISYRIEGKDIVKEK